MSPSAIHQSLPNGHGTTDEKSNIKPGMIGDIRNLYQSKPDDRGRTTWVEEYPDDLTKAAENAESAKYALLIRNKKCYNGRKSLEIDSIVIQSPLLKTSLGQVLKGYPGITTTLDRLTFSAPFKPFVHRWKNLVHVLEQESDPEAKAHLTLLHRVLEQELRDDLKALDDYILNGVITFSTCWMIFEPGVLVYGVKDGQPAVAKLSDGSYCKTRCGMIFSLPCTMVDWDGEHFGWTTANFAIGDFGGTAKITKLSAYPFNYHPKLEKTKTELIQRGKVFEALSGYHYKHYQGIAVGQGPLGDQSGTTRIIIDTYAWNRFNPDRQVSLGSLSPKSRKAVVNKTPDSDEDSDNDYSDEDEDCFDDICGSDYESDTEPPDPDSNKIAPAPLTNTQLLMCGATLRGYSLRNKKWLTFSINSVKPITFDTNAFASLVLPADHKELILALTESQVQNKEAFDDVIQGKGKGMIILLSGSPGVGKTLTAESVAENMRAPLYMMSAGDLGLSSAEVESSLSNVLEMATKWNAILLLDEADVFLEQRSSNDLERNKLVSIFLRILEYYEGVLFLTTNRVDNIDAAFQSRIHISMQYDELSLSARKQVWSNFLGAAVKGGRHAFGEADLEKLGQFRMNGREIKNVLKTAQLLACRKGEGLGVQHVESVLAIEQRHVGLQREEAVVGTSVE